ncbi:MAG: hypothetical protein ABS35_38885 [Kaistia sp. SCN 65-12]|nr:MAG: hypothetical protein ABS35_38885 [Kaistia sp. SCN 65-12]
MLVWIASYPRSGNHLLRMVLKRCFDLGSYEVYQNEVDSLDPTLPDVLGAERFDDETTEQFLQRARSSEGLFLVKTHDPVPDTDPCIYIVRDARAALVSYQKFQSDFSGHDCSIEDIIAGKVWPGSWQEHVGLFLQRSATNTLLLRYEDLASESPPLALIGEFLKLDTLRRFDVEFSDLNARESKMFGTGHNRVGVETIQKNHRDLFWEKCGPMMQRLGYSEGSVRQVSGTASVPMLTAALPPRSMAEVLIVTPVFNGAEHLDEAIASVVSQAGNFTIRYHVQDGGSSDLSVEIARRWRARIEDGEFPLKCAGVEMTIDSRRDAGMYDAIANGFRSLNPTQDSLMTWINSDDRLPPGAVETVVEIFRDHPRVELAGGRVELIDRSGEVIVSGSLTAVPRKTLAAGLNDGRTLPFIQQEGTFWRGALWNRVGGIDTKFRLAGDWDLWRRFAAEVDFVAIDAVTGSHRRHPGQLTAEMAAYYSEIDDRLLVSSNDSSIVHQGYLEWWRPNKPADDQYGAMIVQKNLAGRWRVIEPKSLPAPARHKLLPYDGSWAVVSGVDNPEGPFPEIGIDAICYWTIQKVAVLEIFSSSAGRRRLSFELRGMVPGQKVDVRIDGVTLVKGALKGALPKKKVLSVEWDFAAGPCRIELEVDRLLETSEGRSLGVLLSGMEWAPPSPSRAWLPRACRALAGQFGLARPK